jgi:membrane protein involved in colicin uptake
MGNNSSTPSASTNKSGLQLAQDRLSRQPKKDGPRNHRDMEQLDEERLREYQRKKSQREVSKRRLSQQWAEHQQANSAVKAPEKENSSWFGK